MCKCDLMWSPLTFPGLLHFLRWILWSTHFILSKCMLLISRAYVLAPVMLVMLPLVSATLVLRHVVILSVGFLFGCYDSSVLWPDLQRFLGSTTTVSISLESMHLSFTGPFLVLQSDCIQALLWPNIPQLSSSHSILTFASYDSLWRQGLLLNCLWISSKWIWHRLPQSALLEWRNKRVVLLISPITRKPGMFYVLVSQ